MIQTNLPTASQFYLKSSYKISELHYASFYLTTQEKLIIDKAHQQTHAYQMEKSKFHLPQKATTSLLYQHNN